VPLEVLNSQASQHVLLSCNCLKSAQLFENTQLAYSFVNKTCATYVIFVILQPYVTH
jgi:hypothetical protein